MVSPLNWINSFAEAKLNERMKEMKNKDGSICIPYEKTHSIPYFVILCLQICYAI